jgi:hypothetical protein
VVSDILECGAVSLSICFMAFQDSVVVSSVRAMIPRRSLEGDTSKDTQIFQKSGSHLKILAARRVI